LVPIKTAGRKILRTGRSRLVKTKPSERFRRLQGITQVQILFWGSVTVRSHNNASEGTRC